MNGICEQKIQSRDWRISKLCRSAGTGGRRRKNQSLSGASASPKASR
jgi:hypothetical protein